MNRRRTLSLGAVILVAVVLSGYAYLANVYLPIAAIGAPGPIPSGTYASYAGSQPDPFGTGQVYLYCSTANGRFAWLVSLRNTGPLTVTILGGDPGPAPVTAVTNVNGFSLLDFGATREAGEAGQPIDLVDLTDPRTASVLVPTTLGSGAELDVWARYQMGNLPLSVLGTEWQRSLWVRYSVLGVVRTAEVPLATGIGITGCPAPSG